MEDKTALVGFMRSLVDAIASEIDADDAQQWAANLFYDIRVITVYFNRVLVS